MSHVDVWRGDQLESRHVVSIAVVSADGRQIAASGDAGRPVVARSAVKPLQALPLVEDGVVERFGLTQPQLALACASHSGEAVHVAGVRAMLERIGLPEDALACGPHQPFDRAARHALRDSGESAGRVHNNCSGKHAGMLALAVAHGWPTDGYHRREHPVQQRMLREVARWSGVAVADLGVAIDGCGVATFALPLDRLAAAFAAFCGSRDAEGAGRVVAAMAAHPVLVAGTTRLCTRVLQVTAGRIMLKVGAEGVYCAAAPAAGVGLALKVEDGATRASEPALLAVLHELELLTAAELSELGEYAEPVITNTRGEEVGAVRATVRLERF